MCNGPSHGSGSTGDCSGDLWVFGPWPFTDSSRPDGPVHCDGGSAGVTYGQIEARFGLSNASASRSVNALSEGARHRKSALGLVEIFRDVDEGRRYRVGSPPKDKH